MFFSVHENKKKNTFTALQSLENAFLYTVEQLDMKCSGWWRQTDRDPNCYWNKESFAGALEWVDRMAEKFPWFKYYRHFTNVAGWGKGLVDLMGYLFGREYREKVSKHLGTDARDMQKVVDCIILISKVLL